MQCLEPKFYAEFLRLMNLADDPAFQQQYDRALWPQLTRRLAEIFAGEPRDHWAGLFNGTDACVAPVLSPEEALNHPMNTSRQAWRTVDGTLQAAAAPRFSDHPWTQKPSPTRGEHSEAIKAELDALRGSASSSG